MILKMYQIMPLEKSEYAILPRGSNKPKPLFSVLATAVWMTSTNLLLFRDNLRGALPIVSKQGSAGSKPVTLSMTKPLFDFNISAAWPTVCAPRLWPMKCTRPQLSELTFLLTFQCSVSLIINLNYRIHKCNCYKVYCSSLLFFNILIKSKIHGKGSNQKDKKRIPSKILPNGSML